MHRMITKSMKGTKAGQSFADVQGRLRFTKTRLSMIYSVKGCDTYDPMTQEFLYLQGVTREIVMIRIMSDESS